ncbi:MAG: PAS domain S-box protein [Cyanobacteria bacterium SID2]|nr:PAS domain S-box protein [Cyanobacteria bacterium SID2]
MNARSYRLLLVDENRSIASHLEPLLDRLFPSRYQLDWKSDFNGLFQDEHKGEYDIYFLDARQLPTLTPNFKKHSIALVDSFEAGRAALQVGARDYLVRDRIDLLLLEKTLRSLDLQQSIDSYETILSDVSDVVFITDEFDRFLFVCPNVREVFGYTREEVQQMGYLQALLTDVKLDLSELWKTGTLRDLEGCIVDKFGSPHSIALNVKILDRTRGQILHVCRDVTECKRLEAENLALNTDLEQRVRSRTTELQRLNDTLTQEIRRRTAVEASRLDSEAKFRGIFESAGIGISQVDLDGNWILANRKLLDLLGYTLEELQGMTWQDVTHPDDVEGDIALVQQLLEGHIDRYTLEKRYLRKDGTAVWVKIFITSLHDAAGNPTSYIGAIEDIHDRKQAEAALKQRERDFRTLAENLPDIIARFDRSRRYVYVSPAIEHFTGTPPHAFLGKTNRELGMPEHLISQWDRAIQTVFETERPQELELTQETTNGVKIFQSRLIPEYIDDGLDDGSVAFVLSVTIDITERKQTEAAIERLAEQLLVVVNTVAEGITLSDRAGNFAIFNPQIQAITGYTLEEAKRSENFLKLLYPEPNALREASARLEHILPSGETWRSETQIRAKDGTTKTLLVSTTLITFQERHWFLSTYCDISTRKAATEALKRERNRLAEAQKLAHVGSWEIDLVTFELSWSDETFRIFGLDPDVSGVREPTFLEYLQHIHPDDRATWEEAFRRSISERCSYEIELRVLRSDGELRHVYLNGHPIYADDSEPIRTFCTILDITDRKHYEERLRQSKLFVEHIANAAPQLLYVYDFKRRNCTYLNQQSHEILGYSPEDIQSQGERFLQETLHPEDLASLAALCQDCKRLEDGEVFEVEFRIRHRNGSYRWLQARNVAYIRNDRGVPRQILGTATDITHDKQAQLELTRSENRLQTIVNSTSDALIVVDRAGIVCFANPAAARLFQRPLSRLVGDEFGQPIATGTTVSLQVVRSNGDLGVAEMSVSATQWDGRAMYVVSLRDITERQKAEEALRESELKFRQMAENIQNVFWLFSPQAEELLYVSPAYETIWQRSIEDLYADPYTWLATVYPDDRDRVFQTMKRTQAGEFSRYEYRIQRPSGEIRWIATRTFPIDDDRGEVFRVAGIAEDVTERKQVEAELERYRNQLEEWVEQRTAQLQAANEHLQREVTERQRAQSRLHFQARLLDVVEHAVVATDLSGTISYWNRFAEKLYGWSAAEAMGKNVVRLLSTPGARERKRKLGVSLKRGESESGEFEVRHRDGRVFPILATTSPIFDETDRLVGTVGISIDITERKQAEEALQRANAELGIAIEQQTRDLAEAIKRLQREIVKRKEAETAFRAQVERERLLAQVQERIRQSLDLDEVLETTVCEVRQLLDADRVTFYRSNSDGTMEGIHEARNSDLPSFLGKMTAAVDCVRWKPIAARDSACDRLCVSILSARELQDEVNEFPSVWGILCVQQCSIERHWTDWERELLNQLADRLNIALDQAKLLDNAIRYSRELARSNRELEQFAYIASHDLQEPLRAVTGFAELLEEDYRDRLDGEALEYLNFIVDGARRMQQLIRDLLAFSRVGTRGKAFVSTDLERVLDLAESNLQVSVVESQASISRDRLPCVLADESQMLQLFQNLIGNAIKFRGDRQPEVCVTVEALPNCWQFCVSDNGIGIDPKFSERVFEVFQRLHTRQHYEGTGIGLAICKKIVERHGGRIWVESSSGAGSQFYFTLPRDKGTSEPGNAGEFFD